MSIEDWLKSSEAQTFSSAAREQQPQASSWSNAKSLSSSSSSGTMSIEDWLNSPEARSFSSATPVVKQVRVKKL